MVAARVVGTVCSHAKIHRQTCPAFSTLASVVDVTNLSTRRHHSHFGIHSSLSEYVRVKTKE
jgi:hypothetical protein